MVLAGLGPVLATVDARSPKPVELADYPNAIDHIAFTGSEGGRVAIGVGPRLLVMPWRGDRPPDVGSASELVRLPEKPGNYVVEVAWSPDGSRLAYGIRDREVRVIDAGSGEPIGTPIIIGGVAMAIAWSSDGRSLVVADRDSARLCNAQVGLTIDEIRPGWPIMSIGLDDAPGRPGGVVIAGGHDTGRLLRLDLGSR